MNEALLVERRGRILVVTISRPRARNAIDAETAAAMNVAMDQLEQDEGLHIGIVTGAAGTFCAGADIKAMADGAGSKTGQPRGPFGICRHPPDKPLIAAVEGTAAGGGFEIALACDIIIASTEARLGLTEVRRGMVAAGGGLLRLATRMTYSAAMEAALSGELRNARFYHEHGIVHELTSPGEALNVSLDLATRLLGNGPVALAATVAIMRRSLGGADERSWSMQRGYADRALYSADRHEGIAAFLEKRTPVWQGR